MRGYRRDIPDPDPEKYETWETFKYKYDEKYQSVKFHADENGENGVKSFSLNPNSPQEPFSGYPAQTKILLNKKQGNIAALFQPEFQPDMFDFFFAVDISNSAGSGFLTKDAKIECDILLEIPVNMRPGSYYIYTDTIDGFNISEDVSLIDYVDEIELGLMFANGLPMDAEFALCLRDSLGNIIDSELNKEVFNIDSPERNNAGEVSGNPVVSEDFRVKLSSTTLKQLQETAYITYSVKLGSESTDGENNYFKDTDSFAVKLKLFAKGGYTGDVFGK